jgi:hypothetical protein
MGKNQKGDDYNYQFDTRVGDLGHPGQYGYVPSHLVKQGPHGPTVSASAPVTPAPFGTCQTGVGIDQFGNIWIIRPAP